MGDLKDGLLKMQKSQIGEGQVWLVPDDQVRITAKKRSAHNRRPVLVVMSDKLLQHNGEIINVLPLSSSGDPDLVRYPIGPGFTEVSEDFDAKDSKALLQFYQPIEKTHFSQKCCCVEDNLLDIIKHQLRNLLLGDDVADYDFEL